MELFLPHHSRRRGVSLIEAILVIVIMATSATIGLSTLRRRPLENASVDSGARLVAAQIRAARVRAIQSSLASGDPSTQIVVGLRQSSQPSPQLLLVSEIVTASNRTVAAAMSMDDDLVWSRTPSEIYFDRDGRLPAGLPLPRWTVHNLANDYSRTITIHPVTSIVTVLP